MSNFISVREEVPSEGRTTIVYGEDGESIEVDSAHATAIDFMEGRRIVFQVYARDIDYMIKALQKAQEILGVESEAEVQPEVVAEEVPPEDWKVGDLVECVDEGDNSNVLTRGLRYSLTSGVDEDMDVYVSLDYSGGRGWYFPASSFKFHSREELPDY